MVPRNVEPGLVRIGRLHKNRLPRAASPFPFFIVATVARRFHRKLAGWFALTLSIMLGEGMLVYWAIQQSGQSDRWMLHTRDVIDTLNEISTAASELESSVRGYVITRDAQFQQAYEVGRVRAEARLIKLSLKVADNQSQAERVHWLRILVRETTELLDRQLAAADRGGALFDPGAEQRAMARLQALLAEMKADEDQLLAERGGESSRSQGIFLGLGAAALLFNILITGLVFTLMRRETRQRLAAERQLTAANQHLSASLGEAGLTAARLAKTVENIPLGVLLLDTRLSIVSFNDRFVELLQLPPGLIRPGDSLDRVWEYGVQQGERDPADLEMLRARRERLIAHPEDHAFEFTRRDGRIVHARGTPIPGGGFVTLYTDITQQRAEAERLIEARRTAEQTARDKSEFLAMMSHEVRTPMNGVLGLAELLLDTPLSADQRHSVETILRSGASLLDILNDILDFSKIEAGRIELEAIPFHLPELLGDLRSLWGPRAFERGLALELRVAPDAPPDLVGDSGRLRQILSNLIGNAVKFTERGSVTIEVEQLERGAQDCLLRISVNDTGIGMNKAEQARLFQPFSQADASTTRRFGGTGLGLAICHRLVERFGGAIDVQSEKGRGSTFFFTARFALGTAAQGSARTRAAATAAPTKFTGRVLVVEDHPTNRAVARANLIHLGLEVLEAVNGREALDVLAGTQADLVLMDMHMPVMDGLEATRRFRAGERPSTSRARLPIIAMTANVLPEAVQACRASGMDDFLAKPFARDKMVALLARWLPRQAHRGEPVAAMPVPPAPAPGTASSMQADTEVLDLDCYTMLKETMGSEMDGLLEDFRRSARHMLDELRACDAMRDTRLAHRHAHSLASSAATIGAARLAAQARVLEAKIRDESPPDIAPDVEQLCLEFDKVHDALRAHTAQEEEAM